MPNQPRLRAMSSKRCVTAAVADAIHLTGRNPHPPEHSPTVAHPRARLFTLRKAFQYLDTDFFRQRPLDLAHAVPEPDYLALLLDVHGSPPKMTNENITGTILQATKYEIP